MAQCTRARALAQLRQIGINRRVKRLLKILGIGLGLGVAVIACIVGYFALSWPPTYADTPEPAITASDDPEVIARGEYLFHAVAHCPLCHSPIDDVLNLPPDGKLDGKGGHAWHMGALGTIRAPNITPDEATGIGTYTDGQLARAIKHGIKPDGTAALFKIAVGGMSDEDLTAIVSYLRSMPAVSHDVPGSEVGLMGKVLFQGPMAFFAMPKDYAVPPFVKEGGVSVERGKYLFEGPAFCVSCHSEIEFVDDRLQFTGQIGSGRLEPSFPDEFDPDYVFVAPNLTPDPQTSIMFGWTEAQFIERMRAGRTQKGSPMPYEAYRIMTDDDLKSLWAYMQQLPPTQKAIGPTRITKSG